MTIDQDARALVTCDHPVALRFLYEASAMEWCRACGAVRDTEMIDDPWVWPTLATNLAIAIDRGGPTLKPKE